MEILFRGKNISSGKWVEGYIARVHHRNKKGEIESYFFIPERAGKTMRERSVSSDTCGTGKGQPAGSVCGQTAEKHADQAGERRADEFCLSEGHMKKEKMKDLNRAANEAAKAGMTYGRYTQEQYFVEHQEDR